MGLFSGKQQRDEREIVLVKVLCVRAAEETKVMATYNSTLYCLMVVYDDGSRELSEVNSAQMKRYLQYIQI